MPQKNRPVRRSPASLVATSGALIHSGGTKSWYDKLTNRNREYIDNVVEELLKNPDVSVRGVAAGLKDELGLNASVTVIRLKLSELKRGKVR